MGYRSKFSGTEVDRLLDVADETSKRCDNIIIEINKTQLVLDELSLKVVGIEDINNIILTKVEELEKTIEVINGDVNTEGSIDNKINSALNWASL